MARYSFGNFSTVLADLPKLYLRTEQFWQFLPKLYLGTEQFWQFLPKLYLKKIAVLAILVDLISHPTVFH